MNVLVNEPCETNCIQRGWLACSGGLFVLPVCQGALLLFNWWDLFCFPQRSRMMKTDNYKLPLSFTFELSRLCLIIWNLDVVFGQVTRLKA